MKKILYTLVLLVCVTSFGQTAEEYYDIGLEFFQKRENMDAISNLNMAIKINPNYAEAYSLRGTVKSVLGDGYGAISDYSKAIKLGKLDCYSY